MDVVNHNIEKKGLAFIDLTPAVDLFDEPLNERSKTSLRMHYEAQAQVIRRQLGNLDEIRHKIGLSQRKICQLLLVDPSAWSRWVKSDSVPPHILRALQWYLIIQEKIPGLTPQYFIGKDPQVLHQDALRRISEEAKKRSELMENFLGQSIKLEDELEILKIRNLDLEKDYSLILKRFEFMKKSLFGLTLLLAALLAATFLLQFKLF